MCAAQYPVKQEDGPYSNQPTPTSDYSVYPSSARSGSFPEHLQRPYHPTASTGGMMVHHQPTSPSQMSQTSQASQGSDASLLSQPSYSSQSSQPFHSPPSRSRRRSLSTADRDVPIDPSIAAPSPTSAYAFSPYAPSPGSAQHHVPHHPAPTAYPQDAGGPAPLYHQHQHQHPLPHPHQLPHHQHPHHQQHPHASQHPLSHQNPHHHQQQLHHPHSRPDYPRADWPAYSQPPLTPGVPHGVYAGPPGTRPSHQSHDYHQTYPFVHIPGSQQHKRPRRRYEEIERMYKCGFQGCEKGYGTLNHLNAHVTMQTHGPKRTPDEFKEIRKEWRNRRKERDDEMRAKERQGDLEPGAAHNSHNGHISHDGSTTGPVPAPGSGPAPGTEEPPALAAYTGSRPVLPPIGYTATSPYPPPVPGAATAQSVPEYSPSAVYQTSPTTPYGQFPGSPGAPYGQFPPRQCVPEAIL